MGVSCSVHDSGTRASMSAFWDMQLSAELTRADRPSSESRGKCSRQYVSADVWERNRFITPPSYSNAKSADCAPVVGMAADSCGDGRCLLRWVSPCDSTAAMLSTILYVDIGNQCKKIAVLFDFLDFERLDAQKMQFCPIFRDRLEYHRNHTPMNRGNAL